MINITFPDGSVRAFEKGVTGYEIAKSISPRLAEEVLAVAVKPATDTTVGKGVTYDLNRPIEEDSSIVLLKWDDDEGKRVFWHSSSHLMAEALEDIFPGVKFGIGPAIENGFYYDVDLGGRQITDADFAKVEKRMLELAREKQDFVRQDVSKADALKHFEETGDKYKCELISELADGTITYYTNGHFTDLCRGPHLRNTEVIKAVKMRSASNSPESTASPSLRSRCLMNISSSSKRRRSATTARSARRWNFSPSLHVWVSDCRSGCREAP